MGGPPVRLGGDGSPSQRAWRGQEAIPKGREGRESHSDGRGFESPHKRAGRRWQSLTGAGSGCKALLECREGSEGPPGELGLVRRARRSWIPLPEGQEGRKSNTGWSGVVRRHSRRHRRGWKAHPDGCRGWKPSEKGWEELGVPPSGREGSEELEGPPGGLEVVGRDGRG